MSGKRYFQYSIGDLDSSSKKESGMGNWLEDMQKNPYSKLLKERRVKAFVKTLWNL